MKNTLPSSFFQYCLQSMTAMTANRSRIIPTRQPIRMAVLLLSSLATGKPALRVTAENSVKTKQFYDYMCMLV